MSSPIDYSWLWQRLSREFVLDQYSDHGPAHWARVERNGLLLSMKSQADKTVVHLFAVFHDCKRENEMHDPMHGSRGAQTAQQLREHLPISDAQMDLLTYACTHHTEQKHSADPTIGTCFDADRLDLGRVGIIPSPDFMSTEFGREIAQVGSIKPFLDKIKYLESA